jgi:predicted transcriptional regulator of viral defense system
MAMTTAQRVLSLPRRAGVLRPRDLVEHDIPRQYLSLLERRGLIRRTGRGLYVLADSRKVTENHTIAQACKRVPSGVVCLLSGLRLHHLTTQAPFEVWMALDPKDWLPKVDHPLIRFVRFSGAALTDGVERRVMEGVEVRFYNAAKTVADCFKYRNKIGLDVALEALRECRRNRKAAMDDLWHFAKICRVSNVMRPYLEAVAL